MIVTKKDRELKNPRAYSGRGFGGQPPPLLLGIFFNLPKFSHPYKKIFKTPPLKNFWIRPCPSYVLDFILK